MKKSIDVKLYCVFKKYTSIKKIKISFEAKDSIAFFLEKIVNANVDSNFVFSRPLGCDYRLLIKYKNMSFTMIPVYFFCYYKGNYIDASKIMPWSLKNQLNNLYLNN